MAWPLSRFATFVSKKTPAISAAFLNAVQDWINSLGLGEVSLKSLTVDGTGGQTVASPVGGTVTLSATLGAAGANAAPRTPTVPWGQTGLGSRAVAWGSISAAGSVIYGSNIYDVTIPNNAQLYAYRITLNNAPPSGDSTRCVFVANVVAASGTVFLSSALIVNNRLVLNVSTTNIAGGFPQDFNFVVFGE